MQWKKLFETQEAKDILDKEVNELVVRIKRFTDYEALSLSKEIGDLYFEGNYFKPLVMFYELISQGETLEKTIEEVKKGDY